MVSKENDVVYKMYLAHNPKWQHCHPSQRGPAHLRAKQWKEYQTARWRAHHLHLPESSSSSNPLQCHNQDTLSFSFTIMMKNFDKYISIKERTDGTICREHIIVHFDHSPYSNSRNDLHYKGFITSLCSLKWLKIQGYVPNGMRTFSASPPSHPPVKWE